MLAMKEQKGYFVHELDSHIVVYISDGDIMEFLHVSFMMSLQILSRDENSDWWFIYKKLMLMFLTSGCFCHHVPTL